MKRFKLLSLLMLLFAGAGFVEAQELRKFSMQCHQDPLDLTAQKEHKDDGDGYDYAVVKVTSDDDDVNLNDLTFRFGQMKSSKEMRDGELWYFVQRNAKNVRITGKGLKPVDQPLGLTIEAGKTYRMTLSFQKRKVVQRILQFKVSPVNESAIVKVKAEGSADDYQLWGTVDAQGCIDRLLPTGTYLYEVSAASYATVQGRVTLVKGEGNSVETVTLRPNFGYLEVTDANGIAGAEVYVNNQKGGTVPYKSDRMECGGNYQLMISKGELYKTFSSTFEIRQGETTRLSPSLQSNFAETTIKVDNNAEIFVNGESKGNGSWTGALTAGIYNVECRLPLHTSSQKQIEVKSGVSETFVIDKPMPIAGSIYVTSNPSGAKIQLDGRDLGKTTPCKIDQVLAGEHQLRLLLDNYKQENQTVTVKQNETATVEMRLTAVDGAKPEKVVKPKAKKTSVQQNKFELYIQPTFQIGTNMGVGIAAGCYLSHFNIEANAIYGLGKETVNWNHPDYKYPYVEESYSSLSFGGKIGWGIDAGTGLRLTPQVGVGVLCVNGLESKANAIKGSVGLRADYKLTKNIGLVVAPEYSLPVSKSTVYEQISEVSSKIKGWANGFNCSVGVHFNF